MSAAADTIAEIGPGQVEFEDRGEGRFAVRGDLSFQTVVGALEESRELFAPYSTLEVDLGEVRRADSAGLALLLEWVNWARNSAREISFHRIPAQIVSIAQISEVEYMLDRAARWTSGD
ncbi:STAS domain-containing protein [Wenzhouxiangella sp. XN24]|uniref:STAS domain-containing protein n=1 Tax=Wenzhouxiangella sp. XN24 TaxID=2713569 RepID=UPI0013EA61EF|nr:STAS domain-containing protein [Wenzhouxiangella sp. XN24]NGX15445.1 STAS domain-containing protein [Wenzhouxiangella sp. XN24]